MGTREKTIQVGISSCLLGHAVRYDGGHKRHSYIESTLGQYFRFIPFCPETEIGLGVPREPIRLQWQAGEVRCVEVRDPSLDFTERLRDCADGQQAWHADICGYILKMDSPSCGMERVKLFRNDMPERTGQGVYAAQMMNNFPWLPVEEEGRLGDPALRENFIQRVYVLHRWKVMLQEGLSLSTLTRFHTRHSLIIMSHDENGYRELGHLATGATRDNLDELAGRYLELLMKILKKIATRGKHVKVLQRIQGYLKKHLDKDDEKKLAQSIERYRQGELPLLVPITLLKHHFRKCPDPFIADSLYMEPYPRELCLLSDL